MKYLPLFFLLCVDVSLLIPHLYGFQDSWPHTRNYLGREPFFRRPPFCLSHLKIDTDQILVKFKPEVSDQLIHMASAAYQIKKVRRIPRLNIFQWKVPRGIRLDDLILMLNQNPDVEYVEPDYKTFIHSIPDDTFFGYQYALLNVGQEIGETGSPAGFPGADVKALRGWEETKGASGVIIAVIDTGVDFSHPDLRKNILPGGRDFVNDDFNPSDDQGHGTHVCGIIAADTNNHEGVSGITWRCSILPIKGIDANGEGYTSWMIEAIIWAADNGVDIINLSVGAEGPSHSLEEALHYASAKDIVIVSSAGNRNRRAAFPAAYPSCMAVAATDYFDQRTYFSNYGPEIDVAAPGLRIYVCFPTWMVEPGLPPYGFISGTSLSCAYVSGLAGLIKSIKPWLRAGEIRDIIRFSADDVNGVQHPGWDKYIGYGRINTEKALVPIKIKRP